MRSPSDIVQRVIRKWSAAGVLNPPARAEDWVRPGLAQLPAPADMRALYGFSNGMSVMDTDLLLFSPLEDVADDRVLYPSYSPSGTSRLWSVADYCISVFDFALDSAATGCPVYRCTARSAGEPRPEPTLFARDFTELLHLYVDRPEAFWT